MFFDKIEDNEWKQKYKNKAKKYDKKELEHANSQERPLTEDVLHEIANLDNESSNPTMDPNG